MRKFLLWLLLALPGPALAQITPGGGVVIGSPISGSCTNNYNLFNNSGVVGCQANGGGGITIGTTAITSGTTTRVLYDNAGVVGEYTISGSGNVAMTTSPVFTTPTLGVAAGTSLALNSCTISTHVFCAAGSMLFDVTAAMNFGNTNLSITANAGQQFVIKTNGTNLATFRYDHGLVLDSSQPYGFGASTATSTPDTKLVRDAAAILGVRGASTTTAAAMSFYTYGASPPAAPGASIARLYADTSGGKIRLMAIFPSGAAQQIAIEP